MERITLRDNGNFIGWFNLDSAVEIASYVRKEAGHIYGKRLLETASKKKLVVNEWDNSGGDWYYLPEEGELAAVLAEGGYKGQKLLKMLEKYKVRRQK